MITKNKKNYKFLLISDLIGSFFISLLGPFYTLFVNNLSGNFENFGIAFGIAGVAFSLTSYFAGKYSDRFGRKIFLVYSSFIAALSIIAYTFINTITQLFVLQLVNGVISAIYSTTETSLLADITKKSDRGKQIGKYNAIVGTFASLGVIISGFLVSKYGFELMFYIAGLGLFISALFLLWLKN